MSAPPKRSAVAEANAATAATFEMSVSKANEFRPVATIAAAVASRPSSFSSSGGSSPATATSAPCAARAGAEARPRPEPAPVTTATLPLRSMAHTPAITVALFGTETLTSILGAAAAATSYPTASHDRRPEWYQRRQGQQDAVARTRCARQPPNCHRRSASPEDPGWDPGARSATPRTSRAGAAVLGERGVFA